MLPSIELFVSFVDGDVLGWPSLWHSHLPLQPGRSHMTQAWNGYLPTRLCAPSLLRLMYSLPCRTSPEANPNHCLGWAELHIHQSMVQFQMRRCHWYLHIQVVVWQHPNWTLVSLPPPVKRELLLMLLAIRAISPERLAYQQSCEMPSAAPCCWAHWPAKFCWEQNELAWLKARSTVYSSTCRMNLKWFQNISNEIYEFEVPEVLGVLKNFTISCDFCWPPKNPGCHASLPNSMYTARSGRKLSCIWTWLWGFQMLFASNII